MKPGERIRTIQECGDSLASRPMSDVNLTLDQFGFDTWNYTDDDVRGYAISMLREGTDGNLSSLHEYLTGDDAAPAAQDRDHPWGSNPLRLFMSHVHQQRHLVGAVKQILTLRYGIDAFVAHDDIHPSKHWREVIKTGLRTCDGLAAFLAPEFHASQWCDQEVGWAIGRSVPIIPVRMPDNTVRFDGFLEEHQDLTFFAGGEWTLAHQLFLCLLRDRRTHEKGVQALAEAFVNAGSYDSTRALWQLIDAEPRIDPEQLRRIEYAVQTNNQVYDAHVGGALVPDLVKALVARHEPPPPEDPWGSVRPSGFSEEPPF